jgi:hypothetical protein
MGIHILCPICRRFGSTPGFAEIIAATVVLNLLAREKNVSPGLIV